ncbi:MAG: adenylate/guanylate cyclase domain-containing protein [candidate division WS1 bacterium]|jgi:adenylate cyclase|nr:adenylate/guanylate cyclase domain-containing protein [candidate division WS1 bacterium]
MRAVEASGTTGSAGAARLRSLQFCLFLGIALAALQWRYPALFSRADQFAYDLANSHRPNPPAVEDILIVEIDDTSLDDAHLGQFPWPRSTYAELIARLESARAIGIDVLFLEADRLDPVGDAALADAIGRHGRAVLPASILTDRAVSGESRQRLLTWQGKLASAPSSRPSITPDRLQPPVQPLVAAAAAVGFANLVADGDGRYRRFRPYYTGDDSLVYPNFACEVARIAVGADATEMYGGAGGGLTVAGRRVCMSDAHVWINYAGPAGTVPRVSAASLHAGEVPDSDIQGKIVLIGATAAGLYDIHPAPYPGSGGRMCGVETNANVINTLLSARPIAYEPTWLAVVGLPVLSLLAWWLAWRWGAARGAGAIVVGGALLVAVYLGGFWFLDTIGPISARLTALLGVGLASVLDRMREEARLRNRLVEAFAAYVAPEVAERLARNPDDAGLAGTRREITVLFSDVRGFTTVSEDMDPHDVVAQLTEYFNAMVDAVFRFNGLVDKFIGDGLMALFGCFGDETDHSRRSVMAALVMREALPRLNAKWEAEGRPTFRIGIGIHSGVAVVGNMGAKRKWSFTAAGDTVNAASRISDLTKAYKDRWETVILVSEPVARQVEDLVELERIGDQPLRGRQESISVYAVLSARVGARKDEVTTDVAASQAPDPGARV